MRRVLLSVILVSTVASCDVFDDSPPTGSCKGNVGSVAIDGPIDASSTYLKSEGFDDEYDGYLDLSFANGALKVSAEFNDPPTGSDEGKYTLPAPGTNDEQGVVEHWSAWGQPLGSPAWRSGTLEITHAGGRLAGTFDLEFEDGSKVSCDFDIYGE